MEEEPNKNGGAPATEQTPLLAVAAAAADDDDKPLPRAQIALLCYARLVEPVAFFSIFPYVSEMAKRNGHLAVEDVGFYAGVIESLFSLTQMLVMVHWGRASDRFGRKPVLVASLVGVTGATAVFGLARSLWQMILFRCLAGVFAGTLVTIRTMIAEHSTQRTQARAFSWFAFSGNMGILLGPLLGGALADPARQYGGVFRRVAFFAAYPYALSSLVVACVGATAALTTALWVDETLAPEPVRGTPPPPSDPAPDDGERGRRPQPAPPAAPDRSARGLLRSPGVATVLYVYGHIMVLAFAFTSILPVWWFTPVALGGFGFEPLQISLLLGVNGAAQAAWLLLVFPPLQHRVGTNGVLRACAYAYPVFFALCPLGNVLLRRGAVAAFWALAPPVLALGCGVSMSFTAIQLAVNDVAPSPTLLGMLNALALTGVSGLRAVSPALFSSLYAWGARTQWLAGYAIWVLLVALALGFSFVVRYMPDYALLKEERAQRRLGQHEDHDASPGADAR